MSGPAPGVVTAKAIVATARKLTVLFLCMLTRSEDYAHQRPALTKKKLRQLELTAGAPARTKAAAGVWSTNRAILHAERALAEQAEVSYKRMVTDQQAETTSQESGRERDTAAAHSFSHSKRTSRATDQAPDVSTSLRRSPAPTRNLRSRPQPPQPRRRHRLRKFGPNRSHPDRDGPSQRHRTRSHRRPTRRPSVSTPRNLFSQPLDFHRSPNPRLTCRTCLRTGS